MFASVMGEYVFLNFDFVLFVYYESMILFEGFFLFFVTLGTFFFCLLQWHR